MPESTGAQGLHPRVRSCAPADETRTSPTGNMRKPPDGSAQTTRGLGATPMGALARTRLQDKNPPDDSARIAQGLGGSCRVHKPGVPRGPASQQRLGPSRQRTTHGRAQVSEQQARRAIQSPTGRPGRGGTVPTSDSSPPIRSEHPHRSLAHLRTASPTKRPGQSTTSDSNPTSPTGVCKDLAHYSSPTGATRVDWDQPTGDARSEGTGERMGKARKGAQVNP